MKIKYFALLLCLLVTPQTYAVVTGEMMMVRSSEAFPEAMSVLQANIIKQGFTISRVQRVDVGLSAKGYKTDKYRVVFFGKGDEIQTLSKKFPQLIPYLPLKIAIYAEGDSTILVTANPATFHDLFKLPELKPTFDNWLKNITIILKAVQTQD